MDKVKTKVKELLKKLIVIILLISIILSSCSLKVYAFKVDDGPGEKGGAGSMPQDWVSYVLSQAGTPYSQDPKLRMTTHYDCSSFVDRMTAKLLNQQPNGMSTRTIATDSRFKEVPRSELQPWDICWRDGHVEFYAGGGYTFGAHSPSRSAGYGQGQNWEKIYRIVGTPNFQGEQQSASFGKPVDEIKYGQINTNSKFYYDAIPKSEMKATGGGFGLILHKLKEFLGRILNMVLYLIRLPFVGFVTLVETALTNIFEALIGTDVLVEEGAGFTSSVNSNRAVTIDNIIFGRVEALNIDFFVNPSEAIDRINGKTGGGNEIKNVNESENKKAEPDEYKYSNDAETYDEEAYESSPIGIIRASYATLYYSTLLIALALLFLAGLFATIKGIVSTLAEEKAKYKEHLVSWIKGIIYTLLSILYTFFIIKFNKYLVNLIAGAYEAGTGISNLYTMIRSRAYDIRPMIGFTSLILYGMLVWFSVRFAFIYAKRLLQILVLALLGIILPAYSVVVEVIKGEKTLMANWVKELTFLVFIQAFHAILYLVFITIAFNVADTVTGLILALFIMNYMLKFSGTLRDILNISTPGRSILGNTLDGASPAELGFLATNNVIARRLKRDKEHSNVVLNAGAAALDAAGVVGYNAIQRAKDFKNEYLKLGQNVEGEPGGEGTYQQMSEEDMELNQNLSQAGVIDYVDPGSYTPLEIARMKQEGIIEQDANGNLFFNNTAHGRFDKLKGMASNFMDGQRVEPLPTGQKRLLLFEKVYDPRTGKMKRVRVKHTQNAISNFLDSFIMPKNDRKEFVNALKTSAMAAGGLIGSLVYFPILLTDGAVGGAAFRIGRQMRAIGTMAGYAHSNLDTSGSFMGIKNMALAIQSKLSGNRYLSKGNPRKITGLKRLIPGKKFKGGLAYTEMHNAFTEATDEIMEYYSKHQFKDAGDIQYIKLNEDFNKKGRLYTSVMGNKKTLDKARAVNSFLNKTTQVDLAMLQDDARENFIKDGFTNDMQDYGKSVVDFEELQDMSMEGVTKIIEDSYARKYDVTSMIEHNRKYQAKVIHGSEPQNFDEALEVNQVIKQMQDMIMENTLARLSDKKLQDLDSNLVESEVDKVIKENGISITLEDAEYAKYMTVDFVEHTKQRENEVRKRKVSSVLNEPSTEKASTKDEVKYNQIDQGINREAGLEYKAANISTEKFEQMEGLRQKDVGDLTLEEAVELKKDRLISYVEVDKATENYMNRNTLMDMANTKEQREVIERLYNGEDLEGIKAMQGTYATDGDIATAYENEFKQKELLSRDLRKAKRLNDEKILLNTLTDEEKLDYLTRRNLEAGNIDESNLEDYYNNVATEEERRRLDQIVEDNRFRYKAAERAKEKYAKKAREAKEKESTSFSDDLFDIYALDELEELNKEAMKNIEKKRKDKEKKVKKDLKPKKDGDDDDDDE